MKRKNREPSTLPWLLGAIKGQKRYVLALTLAQAAMGICSMGYALLLKELVNSAVGRNRRALVLSCLLLGALLLVQFLIRGFGLYMEEYTRSGLENTLKQRLFDHLLHRDYGKVSATHTGDWMTRLTSDTALAANGLVQILPGLTGMAVRLVGAATLLFLYVPRLAGWILLGGIATVSITWGLRKKLKTLHKKVQAADSRLRVFLTERLSSMMVIRAFAKEDAALEQGIDQMAQHKAARMKRTGVLSFFHNGFSLVINGLYILCAVYCAGGIYQGLMDYGTFTAVLQLATQLQTPLGNISGYFTQYSAVLASSERLMEAENFPEEPRKTQQNPTDFYHRELEALGLRGACFTYQDVPPENRHGVLKNLDLEIRKGEYVAFCGPSGCGKSTALKLLIAMYRLDAGESYLRSSKGEEPLTPGWRELFAYVPQGNQLMSGTIRDAVTFADPEQRHRDAEIRQALEIACGEFVEALPLGLDTQLRERGSGLSEGQMQRIAIARAIFSGRPILLLDEATSALDEETEARLLKNLKSMTDRTVIIVTHRPAALEITDRVIHFKPAQE